MLQAITLPEAEAAVDKGKWQKKFLLWFSISFKIRSFRVIQRHSTTTTTTIRCHVWLKCPPRIETHVVHFTLFLVPVLACPTVSVVLWFGALWVWTALGGTFPTQTVLISQVLVQHKLDSCVCFRSDPSPFFGAPRLVARSWKMRYYLSLRSLGLIFPFL